MPENCSTDSIAAAVRLSNGRLYVSNRGDDSIACFEVSKGSLQLKSICGCGGKSTRDFAVCNNVLICANENDGSVVVLSIVDNKLNEMQKIDVKEALCVTLV